MSLSVIAPQDVFSKVAASMRMPVADGAGLTTPLLAQALRRAAAILTPCTQAELEGSVRRSFAGLGIDDDELHRRVAETLEGLLVYGEIFEMRPISNDVWDTGSVELRPAPPSFVMRRGGAAVLLGVAGDDITPLPDGINDRVKFDGVLRMLSPVSGENLAELLAALGGVELSEGAWLRLPVADAASSHVAHYRALLSKAPSSGTIEKLSIIDNTVDPSFTPSRWVQPSQRHTGMYVARRPQKYGTALWCLVELADGVPSRFLDLTSPGDRLRPCDIGWRVQMAMDAVAGRPQIYQIRQTDSDVFFDFYTPLPSWAERKLAVAGTKVHPHHSLITYHIPNDEADYEAAFLKKYIWLEHRTRGQ